MARPATNKFRIRATDPPPAPAPSRPTHLPVSSAREIFRLESPINRRLAIRNRAPIHLAVERITPARVFIRIRKTRPSRSSLRGFHKTGTVSRKSASVSPGNPAMKLVRIATGPEIVPPYPLDQLQGKISPEAPRFMRFNTGALACCRRQCRL